MSVVNETEYAWSRYVVTIPVGTTAFELPVKIYAARGDGTLWLDAEATQPVETYPVAVDEITVTGAEMKLIGEQARGVPVDSTYLDTTEGMTKSEMTRSESEVVTLPFPLMWNGTEYTEITLYGNGRIYIDGVFAIRIQYWLASWGYAYNGLYTQTGTTSNGKQFWKLRFDGTTYYSSTTSDTYKSIWELFIFDDGTIFINSIFCPTGTSYNYFYINSAQQAWTVNKGGSQYIVATSADSGVTWDFDYLDGVKHTTLYLVRKEDVLYTMTEAVLTAIEAEELTAAVFLEYGFETLSEFSPEGDYSVLCWSAGTAPELTAIVTGTAYPQELTCTVDMGHNSISGLSKIAVNCSGTVMISHRITDGEWTEPITLDDWAAQDCSALYNSLGEDGLLYLKIYLYGGAELYSIKLTFIN